VEHAQYLAKHIPGAKLRIIPGEDHIVWFGDQDTIVSEISSFVTGETAPTPADRALLTLVFLDIVSSTEQLALMGDERWRSVLEQLDHAVGRRIRAFGGTQVKHTGDGYLLSFRGPTSALECAAAVRDDAARLGLQSRTGVHTGECEQRGEDLGGLAVHVAARIMGEAGAGEILASQTVKDLALGAELDFMELEARQLRGVPGDWPLYLLSD
jgi:class 3 adenylate cyclase